MQKVAAYTGTRNLYPYMIASAKSLLMNSDVEKIYFLIEDDSVGEKIPKEIECINVSGQTYFRPDGANMNTHFTYMTMMRSVYALMFPDLDRILSLDVDIFVDSDISDVWELPIDDYYYAASKEPLKSRSDFLYVNVGVALYNLDKLRDGKVHEVINTLNEKKYGCPDQDAFAELCQGHIYEMPSDYNPTRYTLPTSTPKVVHYAGFKNWFNFKEATEYAKIPFSEVMECHKSKKFRKTKKAHYQTKYMIHTNHSRRWYVDDYLIQSMIAQGIDESNISVWDGSFEDSMKWISENECYMDGTWHLTDNIVIGSRFKSITDANRVGVVCGFCNEKMDAANINMIGIVPIAFSWKSQQCIRIPNEYAYEYGEWLKKFDEKDGNKFSVWREYMIAQHPASNAYNFPENIVDLIDGEDGTRAFRFNEQNAVNDIRKKLEQRNRK